MKPSAPHPFAVGERAGIVAALLRSAAEHLSTTHGMLGAGLLSDAEKALIAEAQVRIHGVEQRLQAMSAAGRAKRWRPT